MNGYQSPLWISLPGLADQITQVVTEFAKKSKSIKYEIWYHNEPIWLVWKEELDVTKRVQIAAFYTESWEQLLFIPDAYSFDETKGEMNTTPSDLSDEGTQKARLKDFDSVSEADRKCKLEELLGKAWSVASQLKTTNLTYTGIKVPPKPSLLPSK